jgi:hypothetical protein
MSIDAGPQGKTSVAFEHPGVRCTYTEAVVEAVGTAWMKAGVLWISPVLRHRRTPTANESLGNSKLRDQGGVQRSWQPKEQLGWCKAVRPDVPEVGHTQDLANPGEGQTCAKRLPSAI